MFCPCGGELDFITDSFYIIEDIIRKGPYLVIFDIEGNDYFIDKLFSYLEYLKMDRIDIFKKSHLDKSNISIFSLLDREDKLYICNSCLNIYIGSYTSISLKDDPFYTLCGEIDKKINNLREKPTDFNCGYMEGVLFVKNLLLNSPLEIEFDEKQSNNNLYLYLW